jgi:hypothetical protein
MLSKPTKPPRLYVNRLLHSPGFPWRETPVNPAVNVEEAIHEYLDGMTSTFHEALAASSPKCLVRGGPRLSLPSSYQDETRPRNCLKSQWQATSDPDMRSQVNRSVTYRLNEWKNEQWTTRWNPWPEMSSRCGRWQRGEKWDPTPSTPL